MKKQILNQITEPLPDKKKYKKQGFKHVMGNLLKVTIPHKDLKILSLNIYEIDGY
jgi:hypothetical protein